jgi:hypothetical protein
MDVASGDERGTTERVLTLLGLLQQRQVWTGPELADRLGVTPRTVRRRNHCRHEEAEAQPDAVEGCGDACRDLVEGRHALLRQPAMGGHLRRSTRTGVGGGL